MIIGIPKEILEREHRVSALPEEVVEYVKMGFDVLVESGAGEGTFHADAEYAAAGAVLVRDAEDLFKRADIVLKVKQPVFNMQAGRHEAEMLRKGSMLITFLHPAAPPNHALVHTLADRGVTALTMDSIPRIPRARDMDALSSMSLVTGYKSVIIAANLLPKFVPAIESPLGRTPAAEFLIVGAGVVGMEAVKTATALGATVKVVDTRKEARERAAAAGATVVGVDVPAKFAMDEKGVASELPAEWLIQVRDALAPLVASADVVIASALVPGQVAPILITDEAVASMRPGSVIVDVSVDQGGNCSATVPAEVTVSHGVQVVGYINIPGSMPVHSSWLYAKNMLEFVRNLFKNGPGEPDFEDEIVKHALVTRDGQIVHEGALRALEAEVACAS